MKHITDDIFTARRNARIASAVLARQFCPAVRPSVCHTPVLCQNETRHGAVCTVRLQNVSSFVETKNIPHGRPFPLKSWLQVTYRLLIAASLHTFCLVAPQR